MEENQNKQSWREKWYYIIFKSDTPPSKNFDIILLVLIVISVLIVVFDSVKEISLSAGNWFFIIEWVFTIIFTVEYIVRIIVSRKKARYIRSFYGIIDLLSILPTYLSLVVSGSHFLIIIRILRMLRAFRILKLSRYMKASEVLTISLRESKYKIIVFIEVVLTTVVMMGSLMYLVEGPESDFTSIPRGIYWAIVTLTTVGFGDITPNTILGQFVASIIMILGYSIIAVPTGIISTEMMKTNIMMRSNKQCDECRTMMHEDDAQYCKHCGKKLCKSNG